MLSRRCGQQTNENVIASFRENGMTRQRLVGHHWDGKDELVEAYKPILQTKREDSDEYLKARDVYLLFPPEAEPNSRKQEHQ